MPTKQQHQQLIWVCMCCMLIHANGECGEDCHDRKPWGIIDFKKYEVTMGLLAEEHNDSCPVKITGDWQAVEECDCGHRTFDTSSCEGCGTPLHGDRYAFTLWF